MIGASTSTTLPAEWRIRLPHFEGPLDLLLQLVKINEVEITDIPVALVCDQFQEYLGLMEELNLDIAAEYIYEAALLVHLKSRMLLPQSREEAGESEDPRRELVERLLEYQRIKDAAQSLAEIHSLRRGLVARPRQKLEADQESEILDLGEISLFDLLGAYKHVLERFDREHPPPLLVSGETFSVREQVDRLLGRLSPQRPLDLVEDLRRLSCRAEAVAAFLALLEMVRLDLVRLHRTEGGDIVIYRSTKQVELHELEAVGT